MITFEDAKNIACECLGHEWMLLDELTLEKPYGWYFCFANKAYLASNNTLDDAFGWNGFLVERDAGKYFCFPSYHTRECDLENYEAGLRPHFYDLTITAIHDLTQTAALLARLQLGCVIYEFESGAPWQSPEMLSAPQIESRLVTLPQTFSKEFFFSKAKIFAAIDASGCCEYQLSEHIPIYVPI